MSYSDGNTARRPTAHKNTRVDRRGRARTERDWVREQHTRGKRYAWVLANPHITRKRFTDFQWAVLQARWINVDGTIIRNSSVMVNRTLRAANPRVRITNDARREAELAADVMVAELEDWHHANEHWHRWKAGE